MVFTFIFIIWFWIFIIIVFQSTKTKTGTIITLLSAFLSAYVDIIIYVSSGLRQEDISLISKIRKNNPNLRQLNIISDLDTVVRTDERIKYMHRNNRFEVLREIVCEFMKMEGKISSMKTPTAVAKTGRNNQVRAIEQNLSRLKKLD